MRLFIAMFRDAPWFISGAIRWQSRSEYSHAALVFENEPGALGTARPTSVEVIEAREFKGVRRSDLTADIAEGAKIDLFSIKTNPGDCRSRPSEDQVSLVYQFARMQVGKPYDYTMVARFVTREQEARSASGKWFCSELVFAACLKGSIELLKRVEPWAVSPGLLVQSPLLYFERTLNFTAENAKIAEPQPEGLRLQDCVRRGAFV